MSCDIVEFNIGKKCLSLAIDCDQLRSRLVDKFHEWFGYSSGLCYDAHVTISKAKTSYSDLLALYDLRNTNLLGCDTDTDEFIYKKDDTIFVSSYLHDRCYVFLVVDVINQRIIAYYFDELNFSNLHSLMKLITISAFNYIFNEAVILLHGCAVEFEENKAILFIGPSGAGKTTVSMYCRQNGLQVLSDETVMIWFDRGKFMAQGTPWHGSEGWDIGRSNVCELRAAYCLVKSRVDCVEQFVHKYEQRCVLVNQLLSAAQYNMNKLLDGVSLCSNLISSIALKKLNFTKSANFISTILKDIGV